MRVPSKEIAKLKRVLFVCGHNAGRSQMAEALLRSLSSGKLEAQSAGTEPAEKVNPYAVQVMAERGISLDAHRPKLLTQELADWADIIVTMGCALEEACPALQTVVEDWGIPNPSGQPVDVVRSIRDQIEEKVSLLLREPVDT
jgi:arsenate reductase